MFISSKDTHTSFGVPTPFSYYLQKLHYLNPRTILLPASIGALAFETLAPLLLLAPAAFASIPFALSGLASKRLAGRGFGSVPFQGSCFMTFITSMRERAR